MKSSWMALAVGAALAGCSTGGDGSVFASRDTTVEYYRVFDIQTDPANPAVVKAASEGISRHVADATLATPAFAGTLAEQPGRFKLTDPSSAAPGTGAAHGPSCEGATWTAKAAPRVNGGDNMNMVACLFPYKNGYHLDMYAVFTKKEGGWLEWPRRVTGRFMGTPEKWTDQTMVDVVRAIRDNTGARVAVVEAKPALLGTPWLESTPAPAAAAPAPDTAGSGAKTSGTAATTRPVPAAGTSASAAPAPAPAPAPAAAPAPAPAPAPAVAPATPPADGAASEGAAAASPASGTTPQPATAPTGGAGGSAGKPLK